ncbi:MAG: hypothetical protein QXS85_04850 [Acidilobaceae archaeon]
MQRLAVMTVGVVHESELNVRVASILSESFGLDCRAERALRRARPDIRCFYEGFRVAIEGSYNRSDAESDARRRVEEGLADIAIALHYAERYRDIPEEELARKLRETPLNAMVLAPVEARGLERYLAEKTRIAKPAEGWLEGIKLGDLADIIKLAVAYLVSETEVQREVDSVKQVIGDFVKVASALSEGRELRESVASVLYKLYGFEVSEARDAEVVFGQAALAVLLSSVLYERVRHLHELKPLRDYVKSRGPIDGLREAIEDLMKVDYEPALAPAVDVLRVLPPHLGSQVQRLVDTAIRVSQMSGLLARDFAGRVYHEIAGDIAVRKGFATFYTEIPAAYMLTNLALKELLGVDDIGKLDKNRAGEVIGRICELKIADFACGSGTLLTSTLYNASRIARVVSFLHDLECLCGDGERAVSVEKKLVEDGIYGFDALRYAAQITALNLALMVPEAISRENVASVYLGVTSNNRAWLGSLELLNGAKSFGGMLRWIEGGLRGAVEAVSTTRVVSGKVEVLDSYDLIVMNPPFTRATGRVSREFGEKRRGLFGFIGDERSREAILRRYDEVRERVREELRKIARSLAEKEHVSREYRVLLEESGRGELSLAQYLGIGQAGEGLLFLYLAYKYVRPGGVIAFVLPRNTLSGVSWFLARALLAEKFHVRYVIVSSDPENGYNFSEGTSLSECLIVARRVDSHSPDEETLFVNMLKKPRSALEAIMLSEKISGSVLQRDGLVELASGASCIITRASRKSLLESLDNWNRFVFLPEREVVEIGLRVLEGDLSILGLKVPVARLVELAESIGIDRHQFHDHFSYSSSKTPYPIIYGGGEEVRVSMLVKPNAHAICKTGKAREIFERFSGRVLVPDRIRLSTAHAIAMYSETPILSNMFYAVKLKKPVAEAEKALVLWLNTTWGILSVLMSREETEGPWISLKIAQWRTLPVLDVGKLSEDALRRLASAFDELASAKPRRVVEQYSEDPARVDPVRLRIDLSFIKSIDPSVDESKARESLHHVYKRVAVAFKRWIR